LPTICEFLKLSEQISVDRRSTCEFKNLVDTCAPSRGSFAGIELALEGMGTLERRLPWRASYDFIRPAGQKC
jgi:hypothetical protein